MDALVVSEVPSKRLGVPSFARVVELAADLLRELVDELVRVDEVEGADAFLDHAGGLVEQREVGVDLARRVGPLHLDRDAVPVRQDGAVHLADRGRRDRPLLELDEELLELEPELALDDLAHRGERHGPHVVLEPAQLGDDVRRHDVGAGREQLPELDERRAELVEQLAQADAACGTFLRLGRRPVPPREQVGQLVAFEEVAEAVPDRDLRDLREPAEVPAGRLRHRRQV